MARKSIQDLKEELKLFKHVTPWEDVTIGSVYHIPPIANLSSRDIKIISKENDQATYYKVGDSKKEEHTMHKTSVFARLIVKRKKY